MNYHHNRANGVKWMDLVHNSGEDADWLIENGVNFPEVTRSQLFYSSDRANADYIPAMISAAEKAGGKILTNTMAVGVTQDDSGAISGVIAQKANGDYIQIVAPTVLLSTGGFAQNEDYLREAGFFNPQDVVRFIPGIKGDGVTFARSVGASDILHKATALQQPTVTGAPGGEYGTFGNGNALVVSTRSPNTLWVNEAGARICNENSGGENWMALMIPMLVHKKVYSIYDRKAFEQNFYGGPTAYDRTTEWQYDDETSLKQFDDHFAENIAGDCVMADSIEELAAKAASQFDEMDEEALLETIQHYNEMCAAGRDTDFGKESEYMQEFNSGPFYMIYMPLSVMVTYGALAVSRDYEVVNELREPIPGLYSAGNDACDLWPNIYTINVQCGTSASHVYTGRQTARKAAEYVGSNALGSVTEEGDTSPSVVEQVYEMPESLNDGTYTSEPAQGMFGTITATVTIKDGKIAEITEENEMETPYVGQYAMDDMIVEMVAQNTVQVDGVAGATSSSNGLRSAVEDCLKQAAN